MRDHDVKDRDGQISIEQDANVWERLRNGDEGKGKEARDVEWESAMSFQR